MCRVFLFFSRTCLCTQSSERCWLTANSNCPEAIGSHFQTGSFIFPWKGNGLWPRSLITPLVQRARSSGKPCDKHARPHACMQTNAETKPPEGRGWGRRSEVSGQDAWRNFSSLRKTLPSSGEIVAAILGQSYGLCYQLWSSVQSGSEEFVWMWCRASLKAVTEEKSWEKMRVCACVWVESGQKWERLHFIEVHETLGPLNRTNFKPGCVA